jgi:hypothetical protein
MDNGATDVAKALVRLSALTIFELRGEWRRLHRMPPPMRLSRDLLTWRQSRHEHLLDIGEELRAVDGTVEDTGSGQAIVPQRGQKSCRLP